MTRPPGWAHDIAWTAVNRHGAAQRTGELATALEVVDGLAADRLLEIGSHHGGTLWCWAQLGIMHRYAITAPVPGPQYVHSHGAALLWSDSHDPAARQWMRATLAGARLDVLFIDGDHTTAGCLADWVDYGPLVRPGGLVLVHDICYTPTVRAAWDQITAGWPVQAAELPPDPADPVGFGVVTITEETFT